MYTVILLELDMSNVTFDLSHCYIVTPKNSIYYAMENTETWPLARSHNTHMAATTTSVVKEIKLDLRPEDGKDIEPRSDGLAGPHQNLRSSC